MARPQTLHILNKAPEHPRFAQCLKAAGSDDALLLTENAVLAASRSDLRYPCPIYLLEPDMRARSVTFDNSDQVVDYAGMVALTVEATRVISW